MDPKPRPNQALYLEVLRKMTPEQRLRKAIELTELRKQVLRDGLRQRFPDLDDHALHELYLKQLEICHNRNY
jgi:hypothetical protein